MYLANISNNDKFSLFFQQDLIAKLKITRIDIGSRLHKI